MSNLKRGAFALLVVMLCVGVVSVGAQQKMPVPKKTSYRFATWVTPELQVYNQLSIKALQRDFPTVKVDTEVTPFASYVQKMLVDIAAGTAPDVFQVSYGWTGTFVKQKALLDLKPIYASMALPKGVTPISDYSATTMAALTYDGQLVGIPMESYSPAIIYNKTMFTKAGIPYPTPSWTWDDLKSIAKKLTIPNQQWGIYPYAVISYHAALVEGNGGQYTGPDGHAVGYLNSPKVVEASQFFLDLFTQGYAPTPGMISSMGNTAIPLLISGKLGMVLNTGMWILDTMKTQGVDVEGTMGIIPPPRPEAITLGVHAFCVGKSAADKEMSALIALYLGGAQEVIDKSASSYRAVPILACQKQQLVAMPSIKPMYDSWADSRGRAFTMDPSIDGVTLLQVYQTAFEAAIAGKATLKDALTTAAQDYDQRVFGTK